MSMFTYPYRIYKMLTAHLGDNDIFPLLEILYDPSLIISLRVFLLGILFANNTFAAPNLTSLDKLSRLDIHPGEQKPVLPLSEGLNNTFVFRNAIKRRTSYKMSRREGMPSSTVAA